MFPYKIIEQELQTWTNSVLVVCRSHEKRCVIDDNWPQFAMNNGYNEEEFQAWCQVFKFFEGDSLLYDVQQCTRNMPYDLQFFLNVRSRNPTDTLFELILKYKSEKQEETLARQFIFLHDLNGMDEKKPKEAVALMLLHLPTIDRTYIINPSLMYEENGRIYANNAYIAILLKSYWGEPLAVRMSQIQKEICIEAEEESVLK